MSSVYEDEDAAPLLGGEEYARAYDAAAAAAAAAPAARSLPGLPEYSYDNCGPDASKQSPFPPSCSSCGAPKPDTRFCPSCGTMEGRSDGAAGAAGAPAWPAPSAPPADMPPAYTAATAAPPPTAELPGCA